MKMSIHEDEDNLEADIPEEGPEYIPVPDVDLDLEEGEEPMIDEDEME